MKTLQECKDQVAKKYHNTTWAIWSEQRTFPISESIQTEAAELYARSVWDAACEAQKKICNDMLMEPGRNNVNGAPKPQFKK